MGRFDRYLLSQLMVVFGFFSLILVMVYWINRAVVLFDQLIADGQSAGVFLEFTALSLPAVIRLALPLAAFAAAVYVTNRLSSDSELVVVQATGFSPWRMARPILFFGLIVTLMMSVLMHFLVPLSTSQLNERTAEISQNMTSRLLTEGQFIEPASGVTLYIQEITPSGELRNLFLSDNRAVESSTTYTATQAYLVRTNEAAQLVMIDGQIQTFETATGRLAVTSFDDFAYNIGSLMAPTDRTGRRSRELTTPELLRATPEIQQETGRTAAQLVAEGHDRFAQSILATVGALLGFSALIVGSFSRFGVWRQIVLAIFLIIVIKGLETVGLNMARSDPSRWLGVYLPSATGLIFVAALLWFSAHPAAFRSRATKASP